MGLGPMFRMRSMAGLLPPLSVSTEISRSRPDMHRLSIRSWWRDENPKGWGWDIKGIEPETLAEKGTAPRETIDLRMGDTNQCCEEPLLQ